MSVNEVVTSITLQYEDAGYTSFMNNLNRAQSALSRTLSMTETGVAANRSSKKLAAFGHAVDSVANTNAKSKNSVIPYTESLRKTISSGTKNTPLIDAITSSKPLAELSSLTGKQLGEKLGYGAKKAKELKNELNSAANSLTKMNRAVQTGSVNGELRAMLTQGMDTLHSKGTMGKSALSQSENMLTKLAAAMETGAITSTFMPQSVFEQAQSVVPTTAQLDRKDRERIRKAEAAQRAAAEERARQELDTLKESAKAEAAQRAAAEERAKQEQDAVKEAAKEEKARRTKTREKNVAKAAQSEQILTTSKAARNTMTSAMSNIRSNLAGVQSAINTGDIDRAKASYRAMAPTLREMNTSCNDAVKSLRKLATNGATAEIRANALTHAEKLQEVQHSLTSKAVMMQSKAQRTLSKTNEIATMSSGVLMKTLQRLRGAFWSVYLAIMLLGRGFGVWFDKASEFAETSHLLYSTLYNSMKKDVDKIKSDEELQITAKDLFGNPVETNQKNGIPGLTRDVKDTIEATVNELDAMADRRLIDPTNFKKTYATFYEMANSAGMASDKVLELSKGLTALTYDVGSLWDEDFESVARKMRSALAGVTQSVRMFGIDVSRTSADTWLAAHGYDAVYNSLSRASKMAVIYNMVAEHTGTAMNDLANSAMQPANQLRLLKEQTTYAARALGAALFPVITPLISIFTMLMVAVRNAASALNGFFSFALGSKYDNSFTAWQSFLNQLGNSGGADTEGIDAVADAMDDAGSSTGSATDKLKEFKKQLLGFDEINNITPKDDSSDGGGGGGSPAGGGSGAELDIPVPKWSETIENVFGSLQSYLNSVLGGLMQVFSNFIQGFLPGFGAGFAAAFAPLLLFIQGVSTAISALREMFGTTEDGRYYFDIFVETLGKVIGAFDGFLVGGALIGGLLGKLFPKIVGNGRQLGFLEKRVAATAEKGKLLHGIWSGLSKAFAFFTSPLGIVVLAIAAFVALCVKAYKKSEKFREKIAKLKDLISQVGKAFGGSIKAAFEKFSDSLEKMKNATHIDIWDALGKALGVILDVLTYLAIAIAAVLTGIVDAVTYVASVAMDAITWLVDLFKGGDKDVKYTMTYEEKRTIREERRAARKEEREKRREERRKNGGGGLFSPQVAYADELTPSVNTEPAEKELDTFGQRYAVWKRDTGAAWSKAFKDMGTTAKEKLANVSNTVKTWGSNTKSTWSNAFNETKTKCRESLEQVKSYFKTKLDGAKTHITNFKTKIGEISTKIKNMKNNAIAHLESFRNKIAEKFDKAKTKVSNFLTKIQNIPESIKNAFNVLSELHIKADWSKLSLANIKKALSNGKLWDVVPLSVEWYAKGGVFNGASLIGVGEAGPEAAVPLTGARMQPFSRAIASNLNGMNIQRNDDIDKELIAATNKQNELLRKQNDLLTALLNKNTDVRIDGRSVVQAINRTTANRSATLR